MAISVFNRGGSGGLKPQIIVTAFAGSRLTCDGQTYQLSGSEITHTFSVGIGTHTVTATHDGNTTSKEIVVDRVAQFKANFVAIPVDGVLFKADGTVGTGIELLNAQYNEGAMFWFCLGEFIINGVIFADDAEAISVYPNEASQAPSYLKIDGETVTERSQVVFLRCFDFYIPAKFIDGNEHTITINGFDSNGAMCPIKSTLIRN